MEQREPSKQELASDVWRRLFGFFMSTRRQRDEALKRLSLTPNDARAFASLQAEKGRTMSSLADEWGCDASNATWMVDRLEKRGWAERRALSGDRRVKLVVLTPLGVETRAEFMRAMSEPPPELLGLDTDDLAALQRSLAQLPESDPPYGVADQPSTT